MHKNTVPEVNLELIICTTVRKGQFYKHTKNVAILAFSSYRASKFTRNLAHSQPFQSLHSESSLTTREYQVP